MSPEPMTPIAVGLPSETARLKTVVMCLANPMGILSFLWQGGFDLAALYQGWHNKWALTHNHRKVRQQQIALAELLQAQGVQVHWAERVTGCLTQHYTRDVGFAIDHTFFLARPRRRSRQRELAGLRNLLPRFSRVARLERGHIEGGDVMVDERYILVGLGEETSLEGVECLRSKLAQLGIKREVVTLEFAHRGVIHLDTRFNLVSRGVALIHPRSFARNSLRWLEGQFELIEATDQEARNVEINTLTLSAQKVVVQHTSHRLARLLEATGLEALKLDYSEVVRLPGGLRCTTLPVERSA